MKKLTLAAMIAGTLLAGTSSAATISYDYTNHAGAAHDPNYEFDRTAWGSFANPIELTLPKFDSALGTLTSAVFNYGGGFKSEGQIDSEDAQAIFVTVKSNATLRFSSTDLSMSSTALTIDGTLFDAPLEADDEVGSADFVGTDSATGLSVADESGLINFVSPLANFIGGAGDLFTVDVFAVSGLSITGTANLSTDIVTDARAQITVEYTYDPASPPPQAVPEPGVLALLGLGLMGTMGLRRRKQA